MHLSTIIQRFRVVGRRSIQRKERGQALVEFTLILAPLMLLVLTILAFWPVFTARDAVAFAAASGAHEAAITGGDADRVEESVDAMLSTAAFDLSTRQVAVVCTGGCARYQPVTVRVSVRVTPWIRLPFMPKSFPVTAQYTRTSEVDGGPSQSAGPSFVQPDNTSFPPAAAWDAPGASTQLPGSADQ